MHKILIVEDDNDINHLLYELLSSEYDVTQSYSGTEALRLARQESFGLVLMDLMLPGKNGEELIPEFKQLSAAPIIVISAKSEIISVVEVLSLGADDYIHKPFDNREILARIEVQLRKSHAIPKEKHEHIQCGSLVYDEALHEIRCRNEVLNLTQKEFELLVLLMKSPHRVHTKSFLYEQVWKEDYWGDDNTLLVHLSRIRTKLSECDPAIKLETIRGVGFKLNV